MPGRTAVCVWLTGLSGAGKSTLATGLAERMRACGVPVVVLDADDLRQGLNCDLGFSSADRAENVRRIAEVAALMVAAGLVTIVAAIAPSRRDRQLARARLGAERFIEVFVDTSLAVCEQRDPRGLYALARAGTITDMVGVTLPYEPPEQAELHLRGDVSAPDALVEQSMAVLRRYGLIIP